MRLKDITIFSPQYVGDNIDGDVSFVPMESLRNGTIDYKTIPFLKAKGKYTYFGNQDLLIAKVTPCFENGNIAIARNLLNGIGFGSSEIFVLRPNKEVISQYLFYLSQSRDFQDKACATMCGVGGLKRISPLFMRTYEFDMPSIENQQRKVSYLDTKLSEIDHQVSLLTSKRDAYLRLKKSIINHVVTHGLNPNVKMKDSGIEWIGEVPKHWEVKRMKELSAIGSGTTPKSGEDKYYENGIHPWLNTSDVQDCVINEAKFSITDKALNDYSVLKYYPIGTILIAMYGGGTIGNVALMNISATINQACCAIVSNEKLLLPKYLFCYLKCHKKKIISLGFGGTQVNLSQAIIAQLPVVLPPLPEQHALATYLDDKCAKIDTILSNLNKQISCYGDLKRSLIDEVITGKRAV